MTVLTKKSEQKRPATLALLRTSPDRWARIAKSFNAMRVVAYSLPLTSDEVLSTFLALVGSRI
jgi:hypothetical protein